MSHKKTTLRWFSFHSPEMNGWGTRTRTWECQNQNLMPYQLGDTPKNVAILSDCASTCLPQIVRCQLLHFFALLRALSVAYTRVLAEDSLTAFATKPLMFFRGPCLSVGNCVNTALAAASSSKLANTLEPVPVIRAGAN